MTKSIAITREASLAARAIARLEQAAAKTLNGGNPTLQLVADPSGITALVRDEFGTTVTIQHGRISVDVTPEEAE